MIWFIVSKRNTSGMLEVVQQIKLPFLHSFLNGTRFFFFFFFFVLFLVSFFHGMPKLGSTVQRPESGTQIVLSMS